MNSENVIQLFAWFFITQFHVMRQKCSVGFLGHLTLPQHFLIQKVEDSCLSWFENSVYRIFLIAWIEIK